MKNFWLPTACLTMCLTSSAFAQNQTEAQPALQPLRVQTMRESSYTAGTKVKDEKAAGGFAPSDNWPRDIGKAPAKAGVIYLDAAPEQNIAWGKYRGMRLYLLNTTENGQWFGALDSRLMMVQEARDKEGKWKPIEALPKIFCGNSRHRVFLGPGQYWKFDAPRYTGNYKTKIRFRLTNGESDLLSDEFDGSIDLAQFEVPEKRLR